MSNNLKRSPKITCSNRKKTIAIQLPEYWSIAREYFKLVAEGLKDKAWTLSSETPEDAQYIEFIADSISKAVEKANQREQKQIGNIFG